LAASTEVSELAASTPWALSPPVTITRYGVELLGWLLLPDPPVLLAAVVPELLQAAMLTAAAAAATAASRLRLMLHSYKNYQALA
jgi:hypothetical protein